MRIRVYATLRDLMAQTIQDVPISEVMTVRDVLQQLVASYPALGDKLWDAHGNLTGYVTVLLNGRSIEYLRGVATPASDSDVLSLFPPVGGG